MLHDPVSMKWRVMRTKLARIWEKNGPDVRSALGGKLPRFLLSQEPHAFRDEVPVFVFHTFTPERFEAQLRYLAENGYETLNAEELRCALTQGAAGIRQVALTFDDATASTWTVAYPLLQKYGMHAILFAIPGLTPPGETLSVNLAGVWAGRASQEEVLAREQTQPLCTWPELLEMQRSGLVDIQAHSLTHARIPVSPKVVDFLHPAFDRYSFGNVNIPVASHEPDEAPLRSLRLGQPVYASLSRLSGQARFLEDTQISECLVSHVADNGGRAFFKKKNWRSELLGLHQRLTAGSASPPAYETLEQTEYAIRRELCQSKQVLQERLGGKPVTQFCYPWFQGSPLSDRIAAECGYQVVYYGLERPARVGPAAENLLRVQRVSEEYLFCLPGKRRRSLGRVWAAKVLGAVKHWR